MHIVEVEPPAGWLQESEQTSILKTDPFHRHWEHVKAECLDGAEFEPPTFWSVANPRYLLSRSRPKGESRENVPIGCS